MKLAIITGEASGDLQAAGVVHELKKLLPDLEVFGMGGDRLRAEGVETVHDIREMGVVGLFNVLKQLPMFRRVFADLVAEIERRKPDAVMLVDYPDFNLRMAKRCRELGTKVIYYISPQVWAWRKGRVKQIARDVDQMIVIFPFEEKFYRGHDIPVAYVGHPLVEQLDPLRQSRRAPAQMQPLKLALMPGSRRGEVSSLLPPMLDAVAILQREREVDAFVLQAPTIHREELQALIDGHSATVRIVASEQRQALAGADLSLASSGTATLESAILGVPVVVMYRLSRMTYHAARRLVKLPHFSLVNIVGGQPIVPELLQDDVRGERIAAEARSLLQPERYAATLASLDEVRMRLGSSGASAKAAEAIHSLLQRSVRGEG